MKALLLAILAILTGCSAPSETHPFGTPPAPVYTTNFVGGFTDQEKSEIVTGFDKWQTPLKFDFRVVRVTEAEPRLDMCPGADTHAPPGDRVLGYTYDGSTTCLYVENIAVTDGATLEHVAAHEMGHQLRLSFDGDIHYEGSEPSLMKADIGDCADGPTAIDLAALKAVTK